MKKRFTKNLLKWHKELNKRTMPWKNEKDPYKIWLSEIILQQTRVEQGLEYYNKFISVFPSISDLAMASEETVFKLWEGLGYYSRCKNLLHTARFVYFEAGGKFPHEYEEILKLKGVGPYTAAAIASFAYNKPHAVVDGNVLRVLSRYFALSIPIDTTGGKKIFNDLAHQLLDKQQPAFFNQAIMDFGATICKPQNPLCTSCVLRADCLANKKDLTRILPVKEKILRKSHRYLNYLVIVKGGNTYLKKRTGKDIWQNLFEFFLIETATPQLWTRKSIRQYLQRRWPAVNINIISISRVYKQQLTHRHIEGRFLVIELNILPEEMKDYIPCRLENISSMAFPRLIRSYLEDAKATHFGKVIDQK